MKKLTLLATLTISLMFSPVCWGEWSLRNTPATLQDRLGVTFEPNQETPFTGKYLRIHSNRQKRIEGQYKDGLKTGLWKEWYFNGMKRFVGTYEEGKVIEPVTWWTRLGEKVDKEPNRSGYKSRTVEQIQEQGERYKKRLKRITERMDKGLPPHRWVDHNENPSFQK